MHLLRDSGGLADAHQQCCAFGTTPHLDDQTSYNIHPTPKVNIEWNLSQPFGTPPYRKKYDKSEFIPLKCNISIPAWLVRGAQDYQLHLQGEGLLTHRRAERLISAACLFSQGAK